MANPQQPELARSRKTPSQDQDSVASVVEGQREPATSTPGGPVPEDNQPGHHPPEEQDKPDLQAFAERLGTAAADGDQAASFPGGDGDTSPASQVASTARTTGTGARAAAVLAAIAIPAGVVITRKRRRSRS